MKHVFTLALVAVGVWFYYTKYAAPPSISERSEAVQSTDNNQHYECDGRQYCSQMSSYEEAKFFLDNCPNTKMDGDHDGIPCERQFGR